MGNKIARGKEQSPEQMDFSELPVKNFSDLVILKLCRSLYTHTSEKKQRNLKLF